MAFPALEASSNRSVIWGTKQSFSRTHNPHDNSCLRIIFKTLKQEEIYRKDYRSEKDLLRSIAKFLDFYNHERTHSMNGYRPPDKSETDLL